MSFVVIHRAIHVDPRQVMELEGSKRSELIKNGITILFLMYGRAYYVVNTGVVPN